MAIEEPKFSVVEKKEHYEIRQYGPVLVAETKIDSDFSNAGNKAFEILAGYIFGKNVPNEKIAMTAPVNQAPVAEKIATTAPVTQSKNANGFLVQFTMPAKFTLATLPKPTDPRVQIREIPAKKMAVFSYSGSWSEERYREKLAFFEAELKKDGFKSQGNAIFSRYNSPYQLWFLRRNEIWLELAP